MITLGLIPTRQVEMIAERGEKDIGYAALDDLIFKDIENCHTLPPEVKATHQLMIFLTICQASPDYTTPSPPVLPDCSFDGEDGTCGWQVWRKKSYSSFVFIWPLPNNVTYQFNYLTNNKLNIF